MTYQYKAIIFDCDGVIVDTETVSSTILKSMLAELGLPLSDATLHDHFTGFTNTQNLQTAEAMLGKPLPASFDDDFKQRFHHIIEQHLEPIPGVRTLLSKLMESDAAIAMATNARRDEMNMKLKKIELADVFTTRFCVEDVENGKPAPDLYLTASSELGISPEDCIVIEDSIAGISAGHAAGMRVLAFSGALPADKQMAAGATQCFDSMGQLTTLLGLS